MNITALTHATTLAACLRDLPPEDPRNFAFDETNLPPEQAKFVAALLILVFILGDIRFFLRTRKRIPFLAVFLFIILLALAVTWSEHAVEAGLQIRDLLRDTLWTRIASTCYKRFRVIQTWNFRPWMPLVVDLFRIIATGLESFVILLGIVQDLCLKRKLHRKRLFVALIVIVASAAAASCIMIRTRIEVYGCSYDDNIDRYICRVEKQPYSKRMLTQQQLKTCDFKTQAHIDKRVAQVRLVIGESEDAGRHIPKCTKEDTTALELGGYSRHALLNQFFAEAAIISGVFLAFLVLAIFFEMYIVVKAILMRKVVPPWFLMLTLACIVLKDLYPFFSGLRKIHDKTESFQLVICGCMLSDYTEYKQDINEQAWELVILLFLVDLALTFSKVMDDASCTKRQGGDEESNAGDSIKAGADSDGGEGTSKEAETEEEVTREEAATKEEANEEEKANEEEVKVEHGRRRQRREADMEEIAPPRNLGPRELWRFFSQLRNEAQNR